MDAGCASRFDISWVLPHLALGGRLHADAAAHLARELGVRRVVDLRIEEKDNETLLRRYGMELLHLPTRDACAISQPMLHRGVRWVDAQLDRGESVYVHCEHGIGRSALLVCCVLVSRGYRPRAALERAKNVRAKVSPSPEQLQAFLQWTADWHCGRGEPCPCDTFDELATIAYRHLFTPIE